MASNGGDDIVACPACSCATPRHEVEGLHVVTTAEKDEMAALRERVRKVKDLYDKLPAIPQYVDLKPFSTAVMSTLEGWPEEAASRCSCQFEAGDSACPVHLTCAGCGCSKVDCDAIVAPAIKCCPDCDHSPS